MVLGELIGFVPPAVVGVVLAGFGVVDSVLVLGLTLAGLGEGAVLGWAQSRVLRDEAPSVDGFDWTIATALAAAFAWFVGMVGGALLGADDPPGTLVVGALVPLGCLAVASIGWAQWIVLRRAVQRSAIWIPVNAGAWLLGVAIPVTALSVVPASWSGAAHVTVAIAAAVAMGAVVGAITGRTLEQLLADPPDTGDGGRKAAGSLAG